MGIAAMKEPQRRRESNGSRLFMERDRSTITTGPYRYICRSNQDI
jgi:hypothetical protein